jgi:hypothetical protein
MCLLRRRVGSRKRALLLLRNERIGYITRTPNFKRELSVTKYNIGKGTLALAFDKYVEVLFVEVDERTFENFVSIHAIRETITKMLHRLVIILDTKNMKIEADEDIKKAALRRYQQYLSKLKWAPVEIDDKILRKALEPIH